MVEMKSSEVVLNLAAQLASWRAVLVLVLSWATCKPWQRWASHQRSIFLATCLQQLIRESSGGAAATESRTVGKGRRKRRYADLDGLGANPEPKLGPHGPTLKKGFDELDLSPDFQRADSLGESFWDDCFEEVRAGLDLLPDDDSEAMDPAGSPSSTRKVADTARPSSSSPSAAPDSGWRSFFRHGKGK